jgi:hypothetical protein
MATTTTPVVDARTGGCAGPQEEPVNRHQQGSLTLIAALTVTLFAGIASAQITPFAERVNDSINSGLEYFRGSQDGNGGWGRPTGLAVLCFLEKRGSADWNSPPLGYIGMDAADQDRVRRAIRYCINSIAGLSRVATPQSYDTGACMMASSLYLVTGGPDDVGAAVPVSQAVANGVASLKSTQGNQGTNQGGWNYQNPGSSGDMSTTQFAMAGLSAAAALRPDADDTLPRAAQFIANAQNGDGGHRYQSGNNYPSTSSMSASGGWTYRLSGLPTGDARLQRTMAWLQSHYTYNSITTINNWRSQFYYMWAAAKVFEVTADDGSGNYIFSDDIGGVRDPIADGYADESPRWYYDFAWYLTGNQAGNGSWCNPAGCWNGSAATAYAILVLQRSLGGVCVTDDDEDGLCSTQDNCPEIPNPEQGDLDGDGRGDPCDNCPNVPNRDQEDLDVDGIGDACDEIVCVEEGVDICDGQDNDCDGVIDEGPDGASPVPPGPCATGDAGMCASGQPACINGAILCVPDAEASEEICDGLDNNCDGLIDEGLVNACGRCEADPADICNGIDDDCDGEIDEDAMCPNAGEVCLDGACWSPCEGNECIGRGLYCDPVTGLCIEPCTDVHCDHGWICNDISGDCEDPCSAIDCAPGERCFQGACGPDDCLATGCAEGAICNGIECVPDPCAAANCGAGEFCRDGQCIPSCARISCPLYTTCFDGACVADDCGGVNCPDGQRCVGAGMCEADPCAGVDCREGERCHEGLCVFNDCNSIECPPGQVCEIQQNRPQCVNGWQVEEPVPGGAGGQGGAGGAGGQGGAGGAGGEGNTGGEQRDAGIVGQFDQGPGGVTPEDPAAEGCHCDVGDDAPVDPAALLLLFPLLGLARRRR